VFPEAVLNVLVADNPWLEGENAVPWIKKYVPENYIERIQDVTLDDRVALVIGPRQAGKSTLIWNKLFKIDGPCLFVDCEEPSVRDWAKSSALFIRGLGELVPTNTVVFFEEVQHLEEAGLFLKGLVDRKTSYRFVATGSSSFELESKTRESLAGRAKRHLLLPFSCSELMADDSGPAALETRRQQKISEHLIVHGGYPTVHLGEKKEAVLTGLVESFIIRDASDRFRIRHTEAFRKLLELMASQIGNLCNYSDWASNTGISADTVREYATILSDAHIIKLVRPFAGGKRAEIISAPKVYFVDNGIRNRLFGGFTAFEKRPDKGALLENFVFTELVKNMHPLLDSIRFWRSKSGAEVDFLVEHDGEIIGIEVKAGNARGKLTRSAHSFIDAYAPARFLVVSDRTHEGFKNNNTQVIFTTLPKFLESI
jgi:uncharacterized protein